MLRLARWVLAHRVLVLLVWLVLAVGGAATASHTVSGLSYDFTLPGQASTAADARIERAFGSGGSNNPVVLSVTVPATATLAGEAGRRGVTALEQRVTRTLPGARTASFVSAGDDALLSDDHRTTAVLVYPRPAPGPDPYAAALPALRLSLAGTRVEGAAVRVTGVDALAADTGSGRRGVLVEVLFGGIGALVVLALVFGSFLALVPLVVAAFAILTTFLAVGALETVTDVSFIVQYLIGLIGLGVAIDYSLLVVTRWREARGDGLAGQEAVVAAMTTAGRAVAFSGVTVGVSLVSLLLLPVPFLRSVGITGLLIPLLSVAASLTLLPVLLSWAGRRLEWPHRRGTDPHSRLWAGVARGVRRAPLPVALAATALLLLLASPVLGLRLASAAPASLATTGSAAQGYRDVVRAGLPTGLFQPLQVVVGGSDDTADVRASEQAAQRVAGVAHVLAPAAWTARDGSSARLLDVWTASPPASSQGAASVDGVVRALARVPGTGVGGVPAADRDFVAAVYGHAPLVLGLVGALTFLLLARAFRSVLLPVKALVLNVLSLGAAYGVTVFVWQDGHATQALFGTTGTGAITTWVPVAVFAFLFGLSMDYEVFILTRMREAWDAGATTAGAVDEGLSTTGRLVTSAALILFLAFVALGTVPVTDVQTFATALAAGIAIDALVVRSLLTPALVVLAGRWNWWLPRLSRSTHRPGGPGPT